MPETLDENQAQAELDRALDVRRQRKADHSRSDFDFGQESYRPGYAGEIRMIGWEIKDAIRVTRAKRALRRSR